MLKENVIYQSWDDLVDRVKLNIWSISKEYIDDTIASMPKRLKEIIKRKGARTKLLALESIKLFTTFIKGGILRFDLNKFEINKRKKLELV